jgi:U4/U6 small nuclear ribonucleoprotein PRP3
MKRKNEDGGEDVLEEKKVRRSRFSEAPAAAGGDDAQAASIAAQAAALQVQMRATLGQSVPATASVPVGMSQEAKIAKALEIQQNIQQQLQSVSSSLTAAKGAAKSTYMPAPLLLDAQGRAIDAAGQLVKEAAKPAAISTLQINKPAEAAVKNPYLSHRKEVSDDRMSTFDKRIKATNRQSRAKGSFQFVKAGTYVKQADIQRNKEARMVIAGFSSGRNERAYDAGTGMGHADAVDDGADVQAVASAKKQIDEYSSLELPPAQMDPVPAIEWWDLPYVRKEKRGKKEAFSAEEDMALEATKEWKYVQHPVEVAPAGGERPVERPVEVMLTKKERKRIRRQSRSDREREKQDKIQLGLIPPPAPKVKLSNMMKVLGDTAVADPSKIERQVMQQVLQRQKNHDMRNLARKLTPAERKQKKRDKMHEDTSLECHVALFRVTDLSDPRIRFKVDVNAQENHLTGGVLMCLAAETNLVVVEGGPKSIKRFSKLMLNRIDWNARVGEEDEEDEEMNSDDEGGGGGRPKLGADGRPHVHNTCEPVWQGTVPKHAFNNFRFQECRTAATGKAGGTGRDRSWRSVCA